MAGNLSNEAEKKILEHSVGKTSWSKPTVYIALFTSPAPTDSTFGTEVSGGSYTRLMVSNSGGDSVFGAANTTTGSITNDGTFSTTTAGTSVTAGNGSIVWPQATASWGTVTAVALVDSSSANNASNVIWYGTLTSSKTVDNGDTFQFAPGSLTLSID